VEEAQLVAACLEPDAVISEIARAAGIHVSQLFRWRKELCQAEEPSGGAMSTLVPVVVSEAAPAVSGIALEPPVPSRSRRKRSDVMIDLGRDQRVRFYGASGHDKPFHSNIDDRNAKHCG
jgi:transposase